MYPFSLKLLWAPIVDSIYSKYIGKRKTWLIPLQYMIGLMLILTSNYVKELLDDNDVNNG
jgi:PAT family acetyl-CoA transporter-like MFS transporter 1